MKALARAALALSLTVAIGVGCAVAPTHPAVGPIWNGRLALRLGGETPQQWQAGFSLRGSASQGELDLLGPLGQIVARARWDALGASVERGEALQHFADSTTMTQALTGAAIPLAALFAWLDGRDEGADGWVVQRLQAHRLLAQRLDPPPEISLRIVLDQAP